MPGRRIGTDREPVGRGLHGRGLAEVCRKNRSVRRRQLTPETLEQILHTYRHTRPASSAVRLRRHAGAHLPPPRGGRAGRELYKTLCALAADRSNRVVISSGRDRATLDRWFGKLPVSLAAEHGAFYKECRGGWHEDLHRAAWDSELLELMNRFVERTPRSHLEQKQTALAWHYRETDEWLGTLRAQQLVTALIPLCMRLHLQIMPGNKVVEVKSAEYSKGSEVRRLLRQERYDFILAIGDDTTDDDHVPGPAPGGCHGESRRRLGICPLQSAAAARRTAAGSRRSPKTATPADRSATRSHEGSGPSGKP